MAMIAISHVALSLYHWIVVALRLLADRNFLCRKFWRIKVINILFISGDSVLLNIKKCVQKP